ncbi:MAG: ABC transporter permease, partial [Bacteroidia bacterium]
IALGICVMILAVAIVTGFKSEITQKVTGFASHIQITNYDNNNSYELQPINKELIDTTNLYRLKNVKHVQTFASKPGILKTNSDMQGIVLNGVGKDFDWQFFKQHLVAGNLLQITEKKSNDIIISEKLSKLLKLKVGDKIMVYFIQQPPRQRRFTISGIYSTGMEEFETIGNPMKLEGTKYYFIILKIYLLPKIK